MNSAGPSPAHDADRDVPLDAVPRARMRPPPVRALPASACCGRSAAPPAGRLVLITGPAGCGKTTLLAQYTSALTTPGLVPGRRRRPAGGRPAVPWARRWPPWSPASTGTPGRELGAEAAGALQRVAAERVVLALDDLHELAGSPAELRWSGWSSSPAVAGVGRDVPPSPGLEPAAAACPVRCADRSTTCGSARGRSSGCSPTCTASRSAG